VNQKTSTSKQDNNWQHQQLRQVSLYSQNIMTSA